jgi:hypothetical protein
MDHHIAPLPYASVVFRNAHAERFHPAGDADPRFPPGLGLVTISLLSLALWGAIWLAASGLAAIWQ